MQRTVSPTFRIGRVVLATAGLLMVPLIAMRFSEEVVWTGSDFVIAGILLGGTGMLFELALSRAGTLTYRAAAGLALVSSLFLVWANLAVGLIGSEDNPANALYLGVLAVGFLGTLAARFRPRGMVRTMVAMALAQTGIGLAGVALGLGGAEAGPAEILGVTGFFVTLFLGAAVLFHHAAGDV